MHGFAFDRTGSGGTIGRTEYASGMDGDDACMVTAGVARRRVTGSSCFTMLAAMRPPRAEHMHIWNGWVQIPEYVCMYISIHTYIYI
jgi:hypothetical protein